MAATLSAIFAFEIGDFVYFKTAEHNERQAPQKHMVMERHIQECHGGVQTLYSIGGISGLVPSIALTAKKPPYEKSEAELMRESYMRMQRETAELLSQAKGEDE